MYSPYATVGLAVVMRTTPKSVTAPMRRSSIGSMSPRMALRFKDPGRKDPLAAEGQDLAGQRRRSGARLENLLEVLAKEKGNNDVPVVATHFRQSHVAIRASQGLRLHLRSD
jgi:hypothetical protein